MHELKLNVARYQQMAAYADELTVLSELENAFYRLTEKCWWALCVATLGWAGVQFAATVMSMAWGTQFDPALSMPVRAWLVAFILGTGSSLIMENWNQFCGGWSRTFWWMPFATVLAAFWLSQAQTILP